MSLNLIYQLSGELFPQPFGVHHMFCEAALQNILVWDVSYHFYVSIAQVAFN